jgi:hypothetical protein
MVQKLNQHIEIDSNKFPYEQLDQIQEESSKLKWEYDNEIDAFYKNQKMLESKDKKTVRLSLLFF